MEITADELIAILDQRYERRGQSSRHERGTVTSVSSTGMASVQRTGESAADGEAYASLIPVAVGNDVILERIAGRLVILGPLGTPRVLRPVWLVSRYQPLYGATYTSTGQGTIDISSVIPAHAAWVLCLLQVSDSGAAGSAYAVCANSSYQYLIEVRTQAANVTASCCGWAPVVGGAIYGKHVPTGTQTVYLTIYAWSP